MPLRELTLEERVQRLETAVKVESAGPAHSTLTLTDLGMVIADLLRGRTCEDLTFIERHVRYRLGVKS